MRTALPSVVTETGGEVVTMDSVADGGTRPVATPRGLQRLQSGYRPIVVLAGVWTAAIVLLLLWGLVDVSVARARVRAAEVDHAEDFRFDGPAPVTPAQLVARNDPETLAAVPFHRDLILQQRVIELTVPRPEAVEGTTVEPVRLPPGGQLETHVGQFIDVARGRELDSGWISAVATVRQPHRVLLTVRFDRRNARLGRPGNYLGTVSIVDSRVSRVDVPFTVSLAYPWWQFVGALLLAMLVLATMYLWLLRGSFGSRELTLDDLQRWLFSRNALLSVGTGVAGAISVWTATYFSNPSWGASATAATALFGATFSAFVAAATAVTAAGAEISTAPRDRTDA